MTTMSLKTPTKPWYKEPWPWVLILIPFTAVIMGVIMITLALESEDGLVVDDYYWKGKQINQVLERDHRASALGVDTRLTLDLIKGQVLVQVVEFNGAQPETLQIDFLHSTRSGFDRSVTLARIAPDQYQGELGELVPGRWDIQMSAGDWRVMGSLNVPHERSIRLSAEP
ncbi:MAG: FixH family protein [Gammaproteobacteria bacterium]|nr:FixH family protein [Gammaproteobacteria bacterium]MCP5137018.1 FixH family protein [Gammaproteobacteria bacterium]